MGGIQRTIEGERVMPRVCLTASQRESAKKADQAKALADGLMVHKALTRSTFQDMAEQLDVDVKILRKAIKGEQVYVPLEKALNILLMAGVVEMKKERRTGNV